MPADRRSSRRAPGTFRVGESIANRKDPLPPVVQEIEAHLVDKRLGPRSDRIAKGHIDLAAGRRAPRYCRRRRRARTARRRRRSKPMAGSDGPSVESSAATLAETLPDVGREFAARFRCDGTGETVLWPRPDSSVAAISTRAIARRLALSRRPARSCVMLWGRVVSVRSPSAIASSAAARLPLSTLETYRGCRGASVIVSYQLRKCPRKRSSPSRVFSVRSRRSSRSAVVR